MMGVVVGGVAAVEHTGGVDDAGCGSHGPVHVRILILVRSSPSPPSPSGRVSCCRPRQTPAHKDLPSTSAPGCSLVPDPRQAQAPSAPHLTFE